jgi:hypothetical protein
MDSPSAARPCASQLDPSCASRLASDPPRAAHPARTLRRGHPRLALRSPMLHQRALIVGAASIWAHVTTLCFMRFQMYVAYVSSECCKSKSGVAYVAMAIYVCLKYFSCFKRMLQVFYLDVPYVTLAMSWNRPNYKSTSTKIITGVIKFSHLSPYNSGSLTKSWGISNQPTYKPKS